MPGLAHGVSTRHGGVSDGPYASLNVGLGTADARAHVLENRRRLAEALGCDAIVFPRQVHGGAVHDVRPDEAEAPACDALLLAAPGPAVGVLGADCPGLLLVDPIRRVLAVVHAGWRGVVAGVVPAALERMQALHGSAPEALLAGIGPGIGPARYEVDAPVAQRVAACYGRPEDAVRPGRPGHAQVDLVRAITRQLEHAGVLAQRIERMPTCTYDDAERFFSHRRDAGITGRHALVAAWCA